VEAGVAAARNDTTRAVPPVPPVNVPMGVPPKLIVEPETPICPAPSPVWTTASTSAVVPPEA